MYSISGSAGTAVFLSVTTESKTLSADVTSNAVESGGEVNDHAVAKPVKLDVTGVVSEAGRLALEALQAARSLVTYQGQDSLNGCVITSLKLSSSSKLAGVYSCSVSLQEVRGVQAETVSLAGIVSAKKMSSQTGKTSSETKKSAKKSSTDGLLTTNDYQSYVDQYNSTTGGTSSATESGGKKSGSETGSIVKKTNQSLPQTAPTYSGYTRRS